MSLKLEGLTKQFGENKAVNNLSLEIPEGSLFGFLGGNGAGKTTTFRMILDLIDPTSGKITWNDERITMAKSDLIGYLPEERGLYPKVKVKEQLIYLGKLRGMKGKQAEQELIKWLDYFEVPQYLNQKVEELSKGNQQKIQFIAAVIHQPQLLILDEPFSGLDPINVDMIIDSIKQLKNNGTSIVFSSHQMNRVEELCEDLCILRKGEAVVQGNLKEIKRSFGIQNVIIHTDAPTDFLQNHPDVEDYKETVNGCMVKVTSEQAAQTILRTLDDVFIRKFEIEEPSLHDIFVEKVGEKYA